MDIVKLIVTSPSTSYKHSADAFHTGVIDLRFCIAVQPSKNEKSKRFLFDIVTGSSSVHHFAAESQREREEWIIALNEFLFTKNAVSIDAHHLQSP